MKTGTSVVGILVASLVVACDRHASPPTVSTATPPAAVVISLVVDTVYKVPVGNAPCRGPADARVTILEFADFQDPLCAKSVEPLRQLLAAYPADVRLCFKHDPMPHHEDAPVAAGAAMAAGEQGKFWEMHDKLFANPEKPTRPFLADYAKELGLDVAKFKADVDSAATRARVDACVQEARTFAATSTPTFFINGKGLRGAYPLESFRKAVDKAILEADNVLAEGTPRAQLYEKLIEKGLPKAATPAAPVARQDIKITKADHCKGPEKAKVTILEYGDFQCGPCAGMGDTMKRLLETYPNDLRFCFRHNPLIFHELAPLAAEAAEAAADQGKFWQMHDKLLGTKDLTRPALERYASELDLDLKKFKRALDTQAHKARIDEDTESARRYSARGMPAFFLNGIMISGVQTYDMFHESVGLELGTIKPVDHP